MLAITFGYFTWERYREVRTTSFLRECGKSVLCLQEGHSSGLSQQAIGGSQRVAILLLKQVGCSNDVNRNT